MPKAYGYVYLTTTPTYRRMGWQKIGHTNDLTRRIKDLSCGSNMPERFDCWSYFKFESVEHAKTVERCLHFVLHELGVGVKKEFFDLSALERRVSFESLVRRIVDCLGYECVSSNSATPEAILAGGAPIYGPEFRLNDEKLFRYYLRGARDALAFFLDKIDEVDVEDIAEIYDRVSHLSEVSPNSPEGKRFVSLELLMADAIDEWKRTNWAQVALDDAEHESDFHGLRPHRMDRERRRRGIEIGD